MWDKKFGAKGSSVQMPVVEQRLIESERDIMKLDIIDWNRLNGSWANSFDALQTIASWFVHKAYYTVVKHDLRFAPNIDWPGWKHAGSHEYLGHLYWNDFYYRQRGNLVFSDEPDFHGKLNHPDGGISHFWGDIGKVSAQIFALTQKELGAHDLWISVVDEHTQIIIEPFVNLRDRWASMLIKSATAAKWLKQRLTSRQKVEGDSSMALGQRLTSETPSSRRALPPSSPLRTVRASFPAYRSSLSNAP